MRNVLIGAAALTLAGPAAAHPADPPRPADPRDRELTRSIPDPGQIDAAGETIERVVGAVMDIPIGPLVDAIEAADPEARRDRRRHRRDETVGDVARRDDPYVEERLRDSVRDVTLGMGVLAEEVAVIAPEMRRAIERTQHDVERAMDDARARREGRGRRDEPPRR
jgi:hypothetical protein